MPLPRDPSAPHPVRSRWAAGLVLALSLGVAAATAAVLTGCSSSEPTGPTADEAARTVVSGFGLDPSKLGCLSDRFADEPTAREALAIGGRTSPAQRETLRTVLEDCISPQELGVALASATVAAIPGTDQAAESCIRVTIENFDADTRALFLLGLVLSGDTAVSEIDAQLGAKTDELFRTCGVKLVVPDTTDPTGTTVDQSGSAVSTPER